MRHPHLFSVAHRSSYTVNGDCADGSFTATSDASTECPPSMGTCTDIRGSSRMNYTECTITSAGVNIAASAMVVLATVVMSQIA